jgi:hypothetical protein
LGWNFLPWLHKDAYCDCQFPEGLSDGATHSRDGKARIQCGPLLEDAAGGHFAALEQPELFVDDLRAAFRPFI